ncbi:hypothetical protein [Mesonia oceanica]|mgnify:FL=1|uniref:Uncharacterized protein n=1 Tax=Mesonia oceanica TaxID=2687242 RepID=A0AC61YDP7_9FLAO|nr:hypothetical protein [Mesonia oceanica]MBJ97841.1 hypothetical protein [Flavobacteriaceae bacterium]VVV02568.1 hypothetical protein FVB9532_03875 [Mesonia oceanica]|tara:strand:+ start:984 stop:1703 length:720 start_codon:yes stop_codon:yes gene_type:complete
MEKYKVRTISVFHFVLAFITLILSCAFIVSKIQETINEKPNELIVFLFFAFLIFGIYWVSVKLTSGIAEITLTKRKIEFKWLKKPILKSQDDLSFDLNEIDSWNIQREFHYDTLDINSKFSSISISRFPEWRNDKDDYQSFINTFTQKIGSINKKRLKKIKRNIKSDQKEVNEKPIRDQEAIFNSSIKPKILLGVYIFVMILGVFYVYNNWNTGKSNIGIVIVGLIGCSYYIKKYRNKK